MEETLWGKIFPFSFWVILKGGLLVALGVYLLFAIILLRQILMMTEVISSEFNWLIKVFAWLHLFFSIGVFLFAIIIL